MGFLSKAWSGVKDVAKKVSKPLTAVLPGFVNPWSDKKTLAAYAGAAGLAGGAASIYGSLSGAAGAGSSAAALGKGGAVPIGADAALGAGIGSTMLGGIGNAAGGIGS